MSVTMRVMPRLNLTLDVDTLQALNRHARKAKAPTAAVARRLLRQAIEREEAREQARKLARDYAAGRADARDLLDDLEQAQLDLLDAD